MKTIEIPIYLIRTLHPDGYFSRFTELVGSSGMNHFEAWEALEAERAAFGLPPGYESYQSCQQSKYYHHRRRLVRINTKF